MYKELIPSLVQIQVFDVRIEIYAIHKQYKK